MNFHKSNQKIIWDKARDYVSRIENSKVQDSTAELDSIISGMKKIMGELTPYRNIPKLSELNNKFEEEYLTFMESKSVSASEDIADAKQRVLDDLSSREFEDEILKREVVREFDRLKDDLTSAQMVDEIVLIKANAEKSEKRFIDKFTIEENARREKEAQKSVKVEQNGEGIDTSNSVEITHSQKPVKVIQNVYMKDLVKKRQRIKSEQDIDNFVLSLKKELLSRLDDNNELDILM